MVIKYIDRDGREMNSSFMQGFSESFLADLGRIIAAWSHVEFQFDMLFLSLVVMRGASSGSMRDPNVELMGKPFTRRVRLFKDRLKELDLSGKTRVHIKDVLSRLLKYRDERDRIAHSIFNAKTQIGQIGNEASEAISIYQKWKGKFKNAEFETITQDHLREAFEKIHILYWDLHGLSLDQELRAQRPRQT